MYCRFAPSCATSSSSSARASSICLRSHFAANGEMDFCIALRTAVLKDETLYIQAGGGVVFDSDPEAEYQETVNKSNALRRAAEDAGRFAGRGNG